MFNIGFAELIVVLMVAFLIVGHKDLPKVARWLARLVKGIRKLISDVKKETGWDEMTKEFKDTKTELEDTFKDADISSDLKSAGETVKDHLNSVKNAVENN